MINLSDVCFSYGKQKVFDGVTLTIKPTQVTGIMGPNGSGKSTLIKLMCGLLRAERGIVKVDGENIESIKQKLLGKKVAVVLQTNLIPFSFSALEVVLMGRTPYLPLLGLESKRDVEIARHVMKETDCLQFEARHVGELSGGERQRVMIARALAQEPKVLLLDEPTAFLDLKHQIELYRLLKNLSREKGLTIVSAMHDLHLASAFCDRVVMLKDKTLAHDGLPRDVLKMATIEEVFGVHVGEGGLYIGLPDC